MDMKCNSFKIIIQFDISVHFQHSKVFDNILVLSNWFMATFKTCTLISNEPTSWMGLVSQSELSTDLIKIDQPCYFAWCYIAVFCVQSYHNKCFTIKTNLLFNLRCMCAKSASLSSKIKLIKYENNLVKYQYVSIYIVIRSVPYRNISRYGFEGRYSPLIICYIYF